MLRLSNLRAIVPWMVILVAAGFALFYHLRVNTLDTVAVVAINWFVTHIPEKHASAIATLVSGLFDSPV